jgi:hypothetical protein
MATGCIGMLQSMDHHRSNSFLLAVTWHGSRAVGLTRHWNHEVLDTEALVCATAHLSEWRARRRGRPNKSLAGVRGNIIVWVWIRCKMEEVFWRFCCSLPTSLFPNRLGWNTWCDGREAGEKGCVAVERVWF